LPQQKYPPREILVEKFTDGLVLLVPMWLFRVLRRREALLLAYLARKSGKNTDETTDGWFKLPSKGLERHLRMQPHTVTAGLRALKKQNFIETRKKDFPARLQVRVVWEEIQKAKPPAPKTVSKAEKK
jgi:DNA-binding MarR family transcriptional regulator